MGIYRSKTRTGKQNAALHVYFQILADTLNEAGLDMRVVLKPEIAIPWTERAIKEYLWRPVQIKSVGKESTTELNTREIDVVYEILNRFLSETKGVHVPFPSIELTSEED